MSFGAGLAILLGTCVLFVGTWFSVFFSKELIGITGNAIIDTIVQDRYDR